jgi:hypothetical protein
MGVYNEGAFGQRLVVLARRWILGVMFLAAASAAVAVLAWPSGGEGSGGTVRKVVLDMQPGQEIVNQPNGPLGRHECCTPVAPSSTFQFDIVTFDVTAPGISGFDVTLEYPPGFVVTAVDASQMLAAEPGSGSVTISHDPLPDADFAFSMSASDPGTGYETGDGVLARVTMTPGIPGGIYHIGLTGVVVYDAVGDPMPVSLTLSGDVGVGVPCCGAQPWPEVCGNGIDDDTDSTADEPMPWPVPPSDTDCDGFSDDAEQAIGTDLASRCAVWGPISTWPNWPPTFDGNMLVNVSDVLALKPVFGSQQGDGVYVARKDIAPDPPDGRINVTDILMLKPFFGADCLA